MRRHRPETERPAIAPAAARETALPPSLRILLGLAAGVVVLAGMHLGREIIGPLAVAAVIVIVCHPLRRPLERRGWPRGIATAAVVVSSWLVLLVMALLLVYAGIEFVGLVADFSPELAATGAAVVEMLRAAGIDDAQVLAAVQPLLQPSSLLTAVRSFGGATLSVLTALFFVFAYAIFMAADGARYARAREEYGPAAAPALGRFRAYASGVRRYYVVNAAFGLVVAVLDGLALWALGVPAPLVWAILSFVTNFIPNVGFVLGLVPPAVLALVVGGWPLLLAVVAIYCVVNVVLQVLVQPKFVSDAVSISLTLSFFSVVFWTFVIGPLGAILSIPLTLLARALLWEGDPGTRWLRWLSGDASAAEAPPATRPAAVRDRRRGRSRRR